MSPVEQPYPELHAVWCPTCGRQHGPFGGPVPTRHYSRGHLCRGEWVPITYTLSTVVPPATEEV